MHGRMVGTKQINDSRRGARQSKGVEKEPLQVRIPSSVKRAFKSQAALQGLEPNELFVEIWEQYQRSRREPSKGN
jgi:hypothetical protein